MFWCLRSQKSFPSCSTLSLMESKASSASRRAAFTATSWK